MSAFEHHGGRIDAAMAAWPDAPRPWLDLSTGINPCGWRPPAGLAVDHHALPSPDALRALEAAAAESFGVAAEAVAALPGSEIGLRLLATLDLPKPWRRVVPSYATHGDALPGAQAWRGEDGWPDAGTLLLANPNNPDGRIHPPDILVEAHARLARGCGWLVVDEAFADAVPAASIAPLIGGTDRLILFRSFGKMFGLAGVRLGFVIGPPAVIAAMRARVGDWPVSATAIGYGTAAYRDARWLAESRTAIATRAAAIDALLARAGLSASGDCPLFRLVTRCDAAAIFARLAAAGILVRPFAAEPGWLRFGVPGDAAALARLDRALG